MGRGGNKDNLAANLRNNADKQLVINQDNIVEVRNELNQLNQPIFSGVKLEGWEQGFEKMNSYLNYVDIGMEYTADKLRENWTEWLNYEADKGMYGEQAAMMQEFSDGKAEAFLTGIKLLERLQLKLNS